MKYLDDCDAYKAHRQEEDDLVNEAFADLLQGKFDTEAVHEAMKLGHHSEHQQLREARDTATRVARASGVSP